MFKPEDHNFSLNELSFSKCASSLQIEASLSKYSSHICSLFHIRLASFKNFIMSASRTCNHKHLRARDYILWLVGNLIELADKRAFIFPWGSISFRDNLGIPVSWTASQEIDLDIRVVVAN